MGYATAMFEEIGNLELPSKEVLDVGAQDVSIGSHAEFDQLNRFIRRHNPDGEMLRTSQFPTMIEAREVYTKAGFSYTCIDVDERPGTLRVDLARFEIPRPRGKYGLVVNVGTTEHLASPAATFALMHEMCADGGIIYHDVPLFGLGNHGLINPTPKFWHALIWMNGYKAHSVRARTCDESAMDRGNFYHDYLEYMQGLGNVRNVSSLITAVLEKKGSWPFVVPFDAVFNNDRRGVALAQLLVGSYRPFVATRAYTEREVVDGINNFLKMNGRTFRLKSLDDFGPQDARTPDTVVTPAPSGLLDWLVARFSTPKPAKARSPEPAAQLESEPTPNPIVETTVPEVGPAEATADVASNFSSPDDAVIQIAGTIDRGEVTLASQLADEALRAFPGDWRLHQQKARALELVEPTHSEGIADYVRTLDAAKHYFAAARLAAATDDARVRAPAFISQGRSSLDAADSAAAQAITTLLTGNQQSPPRPLLVVLSTLPKSASAYIWTSLTNGLCLAPLRISTWVTENDYSDRFNEIINLENLRKVQEKGGAIVHGHFSPQGGNRYALNSVDKILVHVRDPRQTVLSWAHFMADPALLKTQGHDNVAQVLSHLSLEDRISWAIDLYLPKQLNYLQSWMDSVRHGLIQTEVKFLRQEDLVADQAAYFASVLDFLGIDRSQFTPPAPPKAGKLHYRAGAVDEWRAALSPAQVDAVQHAVSDELLDYFHWQR